MRKMIIFLFLIISQSLFASSPSFDFFCDQLLQKNPKLTDYSAYFTKDFQKAVPFDYLKRVFSDLYNEIGPCLSIKTQSLGNGKYRLTLNGDKKMDALFSAIFNEKEGLFSGLWLNGIEDPSFQIKSWADVEDKLKTTDQKGKLSATLKTIDNQINLTFNPSEVFAIGSTFKLYIPLPV